MKTAKLKITFMGRPEIDLLIKAPPERSYFQDFASVDDGFLIATTADGRMCGWNLSQILAWEVIPASKDLKGTR